MTKKFTVVIAILVLVIAGVIFFRAKSIPSDRDTTAQKQSFCATGEGGCSANKAADTAQDKFTTLTSQKLALMLEKKDFVFINVHIPYDGEIEKTDVFIPYNEIANKPDKLPRDKSAKIVLYCRSGRMSEIAANELARLGYANVSHLAGGMIDWEKNGYEIIKK